jgi:transposase
LRNDATKTKQKRMDEVAQADIPTEAEWGECGGVLPRAEFARVAFLLVEETAAGRHDGEICGSASGRVSGRRTGGFADRSAAAEWPKPGGRAGIRRGTRAGIVGGGGGGEVIGLPSLHAMDRSQGARIWMASEATDMRCGFDRLAARVNAVIGENPQSGHLFVFRSRRGDRLKILVWERDGFVLWYKRLEAGVFKMPRVEQGARAVELRASELAMILDGIDVSKLKRVPRYERAVRKNE